MNGCNIPPLYDGGGRKETGVHTDRKLEMTEGQPMGGLAMHVRVAYKFGQIGLKWDKSGTFKDRLAPKIG